MTAASGLNRPTIGRFACLRQRECAINFPVAVPFGSGEGTAQPPLPGAPAATGTLSMQKKCRTRQDRTGDTAV